ncbi:MAG: peptidase M23 [Pelagibacteraceae bacterium]|nr:peptidase M23 [Pelagibacteraceae bacterium]
MFAKRFNWKIGLFFLIISISFHLLYLSYNNYQNIILDSAIEITSDNYNYFEPPRFREYYQEIIVEDIDNQVIIEDKLEDKSSLVPIKTIDYETYIIEIKKGDNFAKILKKAGINNNDSNDIIMGGKNIYNFSKIYVGDKINISYKYEGKKLTFLDISYQISEEKILIINLDNNKINYSIDKIKLNSELVYSEGIIETSLYKAMVDQGLSQIVIEEMIRIFSFDVDFQRDIYKGDKFKILFTKKTNDDGKTVKIEDPEYLELYSRGTPLTYYLFKSDDFNEYFDEKGKGMTKSLMKTPINGSRLSSGYGMRKHPILGYDKLHKGLDFAAPSGTPIFAAGNGVIEYIGRNGGYGKYIRIRHDSTYKTAYAHMKSFKKGLNKGDRVKQGDVIGYVGSTGRSTGPHLHYEIIKNNVQINPSTLKLPSGRNLNKEEMVIFKNNIYELNNKIISMQVD